MTTKCISERDFQSVKPWTSDTICVADLHESAVNAGYDAWGKQSKPQPVKVGVKVGLQGTVTAAAAGDALNESTIHYGNLRKTIEACLPREGSQWLLPDALAHTILRTVQDFAAKSTQIAFVDVTTMFPESSPSGDGCGLAVSLIPASNEASVVFHLRDVTLPVIIGINPPERKTKQKIIVNVWLDRLKPHASNECYRVEQIVLKVSRAIPRC